MALNIASEKWVQNIRDVHGQTGEAWLKRLPDTIQQCAARWSLAIHQPFEELSYNFVVRATASNGDPVVVKAGVPGGELTSEIEALRTFDGKGACRLLQADAELGVMVLERVSPGGFLSELAVDDQIVEVGVSVMQHLSVAAPMDGQFRSLEDWGHRTFKKFRQQYGNGRGPLPRDWVDVGEGLLGDLLNSTVEPKLIHGDFHPQNILSSERDGWLAIDPKGVIGDPIYDVAVLVCEPPRRPVDMDFQDLLDRRIALAAEMLSIERQLMLQWSTLLFILSGLWMLEDHGSGWAPVFERAAMLETRRPK